MEEIDIQVERFIINRFVSMPKLFDSLGIDYRLTGNMFCAFHHNENTPSAHLYDDETGWRLWCFSEHRMYGAWDVYKRFMPKINTTQLAIKILEKIPEEKRKLLLKNAGQELEIGKNLFETPLKEFKKHSIDYSTLIKNIVSILEKEED